MNTATISPEPFVPVLPATPAHLHGASSHSGGVSWGAIIAGAAGAAALSLILLILGTGLGLSSVSPWAQDGISASTFGISTILWVIFTQLAAAGLGGYLAGRLRTKWIAVHTDEVYFRDTAHGFLAWAVATLATAALLTTVIGSILGKGAQAGATVAGGAAHAVTAAAGASMAAAQASQGANAGPLNYFVDSLLRKNASAPGAAPVAGAPDQGAPAPTAEIARIFMHGMPEAKLPAEDVQYVGAIVAQRTGLSQADAEKRVNDTYANFQAKLHEAETAAKEAADKARKASADAAMWLFVSLLAGAFIASLAATFGGRRRDA